MRLKRTVYKGLQGGFAKEFVFYPEINEDNFKPAAKMISFFNLIFIEV